MTYSDPAHDATDAEIRRLAKRLHAAYGKAYREMERKAKDALARQSKADAEMVRRVSAGDMTTDQLVAWRRGRAADTTWYTQMVAELAREMGLCDERAAEIVNGAAPKVFADNANFGAFQVEQAAKVDTSWTLVDADTVNTLVRDHPDLLPRVSPKPSKAEAWARKKITSAITQSVLVGDSVPAASRRLRSVVDMDERAATRAARTALTGAENAGRISSYDRARGMGIDVRARWMATLDSRTRDSHRQLDGEVAGDDGKFSNGLRYPGDPEGPAAEVWNCRCTLVASIPGHDVFEGRDTHGLETSYEDWKAGRDPKRQEPADRTMASFFQMPGTIAKINASGVSMTEARHSLTEQLGEYGISSGSFRKLSRVDQQKALDAALSRVLGKLRPSAKRPAGEQPVLEQFRYKGPGFMATEKGLAAVNPHFAEGYKWQNNCQRCVVAWELRQRGYDVTARPFAAHDDIGDSGVACWEFDHNAWSNDSELVKLSKGKKKFKQAVSDAFEEWGDGARAIVRVKWDRRHGGGGHFFSARREGDKIVYEDPQAGTVRDIDATLDNCSSGPLQLWMMRVDDRNLTDLVKEAVTNA